MWWWLGVVAVCVGTVIGAAVLDTARATGAEDLRSLPYGSPLAWVVQDSTLDPPVFPDRIPFADPHETATQVLPLRFGVDVIAVLVLVLGAWSLLTVVARRGRGRSTPIRRAPRTSVRAEIVTPD